MMNIRLILLLVFIASAYNVKAQKQAVEKLPFEKIKTSGLASYEEVNRVFRETGLKVYCDSLSIDQLDRDLLFMQTAHLPFREFLKVTLKDGTDRSVKALFPEDNVKAFWLQAREALRRQNEY